MTKTAVEFFPEPGITLYGGRFTPAGEIKAVVIIIHGMSEHRLYYDPLARFLAENGYLCVNYDQRGHGDTAGKAGEELGHISDIDNFATLVKDAGAVAKALRAEFPDKPLYMFGHSLGSFVVQRFIELYGVLVDGAILSGSNYNRKSLKLAFGKKITDRLVKTRGKRYRSDFVTNIGFKKFNKRFEPCRTELDWLTRDEAMIDKKLADPMQGFGFTVSYYADLIKGFAQTNEDMELILRYLSIYIFSGTEDPVGGYGKGVKKLYKVYKHLKIEDVTLKLYPGGRHEMLNEVNRDIVFDDILNWLELRYPLGVKVPKIFQEEAK